MKENLFLVEWGFYPRVLNSWNTPKWWIDGIFTRCLKMQPWTSSDLNGLRNGPSKHFKVSSNQCICSNDWWEIWVVSKDDKKNVISSEKRWSNIILVKTLIIFFTPFWFLSTYGNGRKLVPWFHVNLKISIGIIGI